MYGPTSFMIVGRRPNGIEGRSILFLNWKDRHHPSAGGAEVVTDHLAQELAKRGYRVTLFTSSFPGAKREEKYHGYTVVRRGSLYTVHIRAFFHWIIHLSREQYDITVDQIHGIPFFAPLYCKGPHVIAFIHEVAGDIWKRTYPLPISTLGRLIELLLFKVYRSVPFVTVSRSTERDLISCGVPRSNIHIIPQPLLVPSSSGSPRKSVVPTLIWVGRIAPVKRVEDIVRAFAIARTHVSRLRLWLVGSGRGTYARFIKQEAEKHRPHITLFGYVGETKKRELLSKAHLLAMSSLKEGYGIVVLEAAALGTPTVSYNVPGLRDAVVHRETGLLCPDNTPAALAAHIVMLMRDEKLYTRLQRQALRHSKAFTPRQCVDVFEQVLECL